MGTKEQSDLGCWWPLLMVKGRGEKKLFFFRKNLNKAANTPHTHTHTHKHTLEHISAEASTVRRTPGISSFSFRKLLAPSRLDSAF